jgi:rubrerythrin
VIDTTTQQTLQAIVRRESRSLLQYVSETYPWVAPEDEDKLARLQKLMEEDRHGTTALSQYLYRRHCPPAFLGWFPHSFTGLGFISLTHVLPLLAEDQRRHIADLERDLSAVQGQEPREQVQKLLEMKRRHLSVLEELAKRSEKAALVS